MIKEKTLQFLCDEYGTRKCPFHTTDGSIYDLCLICVNQSEKKENNKKLH
jgi:hypothetical protein